MDYTTNNTMAQSDVAYEVNGELLSEEQYNQMRRAQLDELYQMFAKQRDDWVTYRAGSGVETRWRNAQALYLGDDADKVDSAFVDSLKNGPANRNKANTANRSKVVINIVRPKVDQAVARMCEILLPVDDRNWGIKPTPVPESVSKMIGSQAETVDPQTGQPTGRTADMEAQEIIKQCKAAADKMANQIDDVLTECGYNGEQRKAIEDGVRIGSGMLLGPFPRNAAKRTWVAQPDGRAQLSIAHEIEPATMRADPWDIWFDPACGNDHQRGQGFFHRRYVTRKEIRDLVGLEGYDTAALKAVLKTKPQRLKIAGGRVVKEDAADDSYEMWVYYGQVEPDDMELLSSRLEGDPLEDVQDGVIMMIGDQVVGAVQSWVPDGSLPIDVWCWRKSDESPYGYGLPDEMSHQQRVVNAAWRQVMDDAKLSIGGQLIMKKKMITPQDGSYDLYPGKVWLANEELDDVRQAMYMFEFQNHAAQLLQIATSAMQFADQETSMPQLLGGEKGSQATAPETLGGMVMLYNNANTVLRLRVKLYDDAITRTHIGRHFDYQMAHSTKSEIKGDMEIDARGSTALLEKDIQNQATMNLANITSNPRYQPYLDPKEELRVILKSFKMTPEDIMLEDAQIEQNQKAQAENPPQDPEAIKAAAAKELKQMELQDNAEDRAFQERKQQAELAHKGAALQYNSQREQSEYEIAMTDSNMQRELAIAKMSQDGQLTQAELESRERLQAIKIDSEAQKFNAEMAVKVRQGSGI
jgi:hypothetical protein